MGVEVDAVGAAGALLRDARPSVRGREPHAPRARCPRRTSSTSRWSRAATRRAASRCCTPPSCASTARRLRRGGARRRAHHRCMMAFFTSKTGEDFKGEVNAKTGAIEFTLEPGAGMQLPEGVDVKTFQPRPARPQLPRVQEGHAARRGRRRQRQLQLDDRRPARGQLQLDPPGRARRARRLPHAAARR
jgi:hypothetical protein